MTISLDSLMLALNQKESELRARIESKDFNPNDQRQLLELQMDMTNFKNMAEMTSNIASKLGQTSSSIIQKI